MYNYSTIPASGVHFIEVCSLSDIPSGERIFFEIGNNPVVVFNIADVLYAIADKCSHDNGPVGEGDVDGQEIICPRHGARFDIKTGRAIRLPAIEDIPSYPVQIENGKVRIGIPAKLLS